MRGVKASVVAAYIELELTQAGVVMSRSRPASGSTIAVSGHREVRQRGITLFYTRIYFLSL